MYKELVTKVFAEISEQAFQELQISNIELVFSEQVADANAYVPLTIETLNIFEVTDVTHLGRVEIMPRLFEALNMLPNNAREAYIKHLLRHELRHIYQVEHNKSLLTENLRFIPCALGAGENPIERDADGWAESKASTELEVAVSRLSTLYYRIHGKILVTNRERQEIRKLWLKVALLSRPNILRFIKIGRAILGRIAARLRRKGVR